MTARCERAGVQTRARCSSRGPPPAASACASLRSRVVEQVADSGERTVAEPCVDLGGLLDGVHARDQWREVDLATRDQVEERRQVAPLGPADVAGGVVDALELVAVVVAARAVGAGEPDVELLLVVVVPGQVHPGLADVDDPCAVTGEAGSDLHRLVGAAAGRQEHVVAAEASTVPPRDGLHRRETVGIGPGAGERPCLLGHLATRLDGVDADHLHPGRDEQADDELTDQPEPDDARHLAELRLGATYALHRDGPDRRERGVLRRRRPRERGHRG